MDEIAFGKRLRQVRNDRGLTLKELAAESGHSHTHITAVENGKRKINIETLVNLANVLHVSTDYLLRDSLQPEHTHKCDKINSVFGALNDEDLNVILENSTARTNNADFLNLVSMLSSLSKEECEVIKSVINLIHK